MKKFEDRHHHPMHLATTLRNTVGVHHDEHENDQITLPSAELDGGRYNASWLSKGNIQHEI